MSDSSRGRDGRTDWTRWAEIDAIFDAILERPHDEWERALVDATTDPEIRTAVRRLLVLAGSSETLQVLVTPEAAVEALDAYAPQVMPERVGPFRPVRELGSGGMGVVYLAERVEGDFRQEVALKVLKPELASAHLLARFRSERRILASLRHPNIAPLVDGGATDDGRPWLAMEYVDGEPLDVYCRARALPTRARVSLVAAVGHAVRAAHQNLVVHRDIKPSNVLVTDDGVPKLVDFGIAKLLDPTAVDDTDHTRVGVRLLTPRYAAPEQREGGPITTATDVFQLGILLIETVTGSAVDGSREGAAARAAAGLKGDLATIAAKAAHPDPDRRYADAGAFADDLGRWLEGRPVTARRDSALYRTRKLLARHPWLGPVAAALVLLSAGWVWTLMRQTAALRVERDRATAAQQQGERERERAEQVSAFMVDLFRSADPSAGGRGDTVSARTLLVRGAARARDELADRPDVLAPLLEAMGEAAWGLGIGELRYDLLDEALAEQARATGDPSPELAEAYGRQTDFMTEEMDFARAVERARELVRIRRALNEHPPLELARALSAHGDALTQAGHLEAAGEALGEAVGLMEAHAATGDAIYRTALNRLAALRRRTGDDAEAEALYRRALEADRADPDTPPRQLAATLNNLGYLLRTQDRFAEAEPLMREALELLATDLEPGDRTLQVGANNLASVLVNQGKADEADAVLRRELARHREVFPADHWRVGSAASVLAVFLAREGRHAEAAPLQQEVVAVYRSALGPNHSWTVRALTLHGTTLLALGDTSGARTVLLEAEAASRLIDDVPDAGPFQAEVREALAQVGGG